MKERWRNNRQTWIAWAVFGVLFLGLCIYLCPRAWRLVDSDMSAEIVLADILDKENALITKSWYYSTEIKVFHTNVLYTLLFKLLPSWHAVRVVSYPALFLILALSAYFFCKRTGHGETAPFVAGALMLPLSDLYFRYALKGGYYLPYIIISFFALALLFHDRAEDYTKKRIWIVAGALVLSFISGLNGPRQMLVLYLPLLLAVCLLFVTEAVTAQVETLRTFWSAFTWKQFFCVSCLCFLCNAAGCAVNMRILARDYHFASWSHLHFIPFDFDRVFLSLAGLLNNLGYMTGEMGLKTVLVNGIALILLAGTVLCVVFALRYRQKVSPAYYFLALFFVCQVLTFVLLYALTDMAYQDLYNLPLIVFAFPLMFMGLREAALFSLVKKAGVFVLIGLMTLSSLSVYQTYADRDQTASLRMIAAELQQAGYTKGFATFWNAGVLTELSDGAIEMWSWDSTVESGDGMQRITGIDQVHPWLQKVSHLSRLPDGRVFFLLTEGELGECVFRHALSEEDVICRAAPYTVYGFEVSSYEELLNRMSRHAGFENMYERAVEDAGGNKTVLPEGEMFGPYMHFYAGTYRVTVTGDGVDGLSCAAHYDIDAALFEEVRTASADAHRIIFEIPVPADRENCSVILHNTAETEIVIDNIVIERISQ